MNSERICLALDDAIKKVTSEKEVAIAFSGGIDSGLIAGIANMYAKSIVLYSVGKVKSYDVINSEYAASQLGLKWNHIDLNEENIEPILREMIRVTGTVSPLTLSFEVPTFCVTKFCKEEHVLGGIGADELFAGYHKYIGMNEDEFFKTRDDDLKRLLTSVIEHEDKVAKYFGKKIYRPFTDSKLMEIALSLPFEEIEPKNELSRKKLLKTISLKMGCEFLAEAKKKAAQYGSGTTELIKSISKKKGMTQSEYILKLCQEELD
ncbi:MAG TPA: asparagine synthase-related protein [Candidatus Methanomethylophilaceae archaeon]|nr:asparagine synthase-related protein [Candidatus Methanomethylophilaceae archaeon]